MKKENALSIWVGLVLIVGCNVSPTSPIDRGPTPSTQPSLIPLPSKTAMVEEKERGKKEEEQKEEQQKIPTVTPEPPLQTSVPYFAYFRSVNQVYQLVVMDADGTGRKVIDLPQEAIQSFPNKQNDLDVKLVSPDGHWMAFYAAVLWEL